MKRIIKWAALAVIIAFLAAQVAQPSRTNPPVKTDFLKTTGARADVAALFRSSCYDCHSDQTRWPWYSYVAPVSWMISQDVQGARHHVNLSEWPATNQELARRKMEDMSDAIDDDDMPPPKYTLIHRDARLTSQQRQRLTDWLDGEAAAMTAGTGQN